MKGLIKGIKIDKFRAAQKEKFKIQIIQFNL